MKNSVVHPVYGTITYEENIWTGKKTVYIGNVLLRKGKKNTYHWSTEGNEEQVTLRGGAFSGVSLNIRGEEIWILSKPAWYDYVLSVLPFMLVLTWGNSTALCSIIPVVGGAIGGAIGGLGMVISMANIRGKSIGGKLLTALLATAVTFAICAALGYLVVLSMITTK